MENERVNIERRKKDAERDMIEMQRRASIPPIPPFVKVNHDTMPSETLNESEQRNDKNENRLQENSENKKSLFGKDILKFLNLENFELDSDRMLLLLMIFLLSRENNDEILLFALAYIML